MDKRVVNFIIFSFAYYIWQSGNKLNLIMLLF